MNKERLEELKQSVDKMYRNQWMNATDTDDLTSLIDAAMQEVKPDDVQRAIALLEKGWIVTGPEGYLRYPDGFDEAIETVIAALRQYRQEPCELERLKTELTDLCNSDRADIPGATWIGGWASALSRVGEILDNWHEGDGGRDDY